MCFYYPTCYKSYRIYVCLSVCLYQTAELKLLAYSLKLLIGEGTSALLREITTRKKLPCPSLSFSLKYWISMIMNDLVLL